MSLSKRQKNIIKALLLERIQNISVTRNPKDSTYPVSITMEIVPTQISQLNKNYKDYSSFARIIAFGESYRLKKTVNIQGDYAVSGERGPKTLRLKINKEDWPEEFNFPENEHDRRLFLQNIRLSNLSILSNYDEGSEEYKNLFPPDEKPNKVEVKFEETKKEEPKKSEPVKTAPSERQQAILDVFDILNDMISDAREKNEIEISNGLSEAQRLFISSVMNKK